jgi:hypothetical protein
MALTFLRVAISTLTRTMILLRESESSDYLRMRLEVYLESMVQRKDDMRLVLVLLLRDFPKKTW